MKSAYELAMERLRKSDPDAVVSLTEEQKQKLAEIDATYKSKIAEREIFLSSKLQEAEASGDPIAIEQIRRQIASERERLEAEREEKKEAVRPKG